MLVKRLILVLCGLLLSLAFALPANAASAHFINASAKISDVNQLVVNWKEAGLGDNQQISYTASAHETTTIVCLDNSGGKPSVSNKGFITRDDTATGTFNSDKNGSITASLPLNQPPVQVQFDCSGPQKQIETAAVKYENIKLVDTTNGIEAPIPSTSKCRLPNVRGGPS